MQVKFGDLMRRYMGEATAERSSYKIQPLLDVYLYSMSHYGMEWGWSDIRQVYTIAIVGGLIVSQILTLYTTPVVYLTLDRLRHRVLNRRRRAGRGGEAALPAGE